MTSLARLSRRVFVLGGATMSAAASFAAPTPKPLADKPDPLAELDAVATAERIQKGEISASEAVYAAVLRAIALQPKLNFLSHPAYDHGLALAKTATGPLGGVPTLIKDLTDWAGEPTRYGARFSRLLPPSVSSAPVVAAYLAAGACPIGKSQTPEFGLMPTTEPKAFGPVRNPWDLNRSAGGSSGGSAAAVAARVVPIAHGGDGGGSLRIPASLCGLVGLKPSRGRMIGDAAGDEDFIVNFGLSRSVRDAAALFAVLEKSDGPYKRLGRVTAPTTDSFRIGYVLCDASGHPADPDVQMAVLSAAAEMMHLGHKVEEVKWPYDGGAFTDAFAKFWQVAAAGYVDDAAKRLGRAPTSGDLEPLTLDLARHGRAVSVDALDHARHVFARSVRGYFGWFAHYDVVISPVVSQPAPPLGWIGPDQLSFLTAWRLSTYAAYTPMANVSGAPALSLPLAQSRSGLPIGVQFMAGLGEDETLLKLALQIEAHKPWAARTPPILTA